MHAIPLFVVQSIFFIAQVKQQMISNVDNVMTDRAVVNAHTILLLSELWKKELTQLLCHLHPLDTISTELKEVLKKLEGDHERSLPKTGCIVYQVLEQVPLPVY